MPRLPFLLSLLIMAGSVLPGAAQAQDAPPPVDPAAVLATLKDLRTKQPAIVNREKTGVLDAINAAIADPVKAYQQAVAAVVFQSGNGSDGARISDWRKKQGDALRNRDFVNGLRLQLVYLALTFQHQMGVKTAGLLPALVDYTGQVANAGDALSAFEPLRKSIGETVFATYFQVTPYLAGLTGWEDRPFNVEGIFQKTILPEMRLEKDPRLLAYWDSHIQTEGNSADASQNPLVINKFKSIRLPTLLWGRAEDEIVLGQQNQAILNMLAIVKAHPDHPDFDKWAARLEDLVAPKAALPTGTAPP